MRLTFENFIGVDYYTNIAITNTNGNAGADTNTNIQGGVIGLLETVKSQSGDSTFGYQIDLQTSDASKTPSHSSLQFQVQSDKFKKSLQFGEIETVYNSTNIKLKNISSRNINLNVVISK